MLSCLLCYESQLGHAFQLPNGTLVLSGESREAVAVSLPTGQLTEAAARDDEAWEADNDADAKAPASPHLARYVA
jgi:hypothetical protein